MNLAKFLKDTLISGYGNGSFTAEQVIIFGMNYLNRGQIAQEDFDDTMLVLYPHEPEEELIL